MQTELETLKRLRQDFLQETTKLDALIAQGEQAEQADNKIRAYIQKIAGVPAIHPESEVAPITPPPATPQPSNLGSLRISTEARKGEIKNDPRILLSALTDEFQHFETLWKKLNGVQYMPRTHSGLRTLIGDMAAAGVIEKSERERGKVIRWKLSSHRASPKVCTPAESVVVTALSRGSATTGMLLGRLYEDSNENRVLFRSHAILELLLQNMMSRGIINGRPKSSGDTIWEAVYAEVPFSLK